MDCRHPVRAALFILAVSPYACRVGTEPLLLRTDPKDGKGRRASGNDQAAVKLQMETVALFMFYPRAFSHIHFCLHSY